MKKTTLALAVAIASVSYVASAALPEDTFYLGGRVGWSKFYKTESQKVRHANKVTDDGVGGGAFVGFQATQYLAAEIGYDWLGKVKYKSHGSHEVGKLSAQGIYVTGKASYPISFITNDLDAYARAGAFVHRTKFRNDHDYNVSPVVALGLDYRLNQDFSTRLEYQWVNKIHNEGPTRPNNGLLTLGVTYSLGSPAVIKDPVETEIREQQFVLNEDVLFNYNKSDLKPEGKLELDSLVSKLEKINPAESMILVIGHTDRIGSVSYNQKLSERRAQSVANYLIAKGVPANLIRVRGAGKSEPVTGDTCNSLRGAKLRDCLAPDRRVAIEIKAKTVQQVVIDDEKNDTK